MDYTFHFLTRRPDDGRDLCAVYLRKVGDYYETGIRVLNGNARPYLANYTRTPLQDDALWEYEHNKERALDAGYVCVLNSVNDIVNTVINGGLPS